jgi:dipeptidyl aminopeptidase/acylaminoacyl peptidase
MAFAVAAANPTNLVVEGIPPIPDTLRSNVARYLGFRPATFNSWHPVRRQMLITTRTNGVAQLCLVAEPDAVARPLTRGPEPVAGGSFQPTRGEYAVFLRDTGGNEFFQLYRLDPAEGKETLLTDGKSRNTGPRWSNGGRWLAYMSTRRNGKDTDLYVIDPLAPKSDRRVLELRGGGWMVEDWAPDDGAILLKEYVSANESHLHIVSVERGAMIRLTPKSDEPVAYGPSRFMRDGKAVITTGDEDAEFQQLIRIDLKSLRRTQLLRGLKWDVEEIAISPDGRQLAYLTNEDGVSRLHLIDLRDNARLPDPQLPALGVLSGLRWHTSGTELAFNLSSARSSQDAFSLELQTGRIEQWTRGDTGAMDSSRFARPALWKLASFDGTLISAIVYRPDERKFPGRRPVLMAIHGGPESQSRPGFLSRYNYFLDELGIALVFPNVRGSAGYGKKFLALDNGLKRLDAVHDLNAIMNGIRNDPSLDGERIAVMGGSYGGYMTLAALVEFNSFLRCGVDVVGISNFVTFLQNTQDYRRDLRRAEYGDERDPAVRAFLEKIAPLNNVKKITRPLFVVQGANDPRVPLSEAEQMVRALRENKVPVWYLMARDEGHGFAKKANADYQFFATVLFLQEHLLK